MMDVQPEPSELTIAYLAGLFDGEGSVGLYNVRSKGDRRAAYYQLRVTVAMRRSRPVELLHETFGGCCFLREARGAVRGNFYWWQATGRQAESFLQRVLPYLLVKQAEAHTALEFCRFRRTQREKWPRNKRMTVAMLAARDEFVSRLKALKRNDAQQ
jgi:hypothetical protein